MAERLTEIQGRFEGERFRFGETLIGDLRIARESRAAADEAGIDSAYVTIKGDAAMDEMATRKTYRLYGQWKDYTNRRTGRTERQFCFTSFTEAAPLDREGVVEYLARIGKGRGLGRRTAEKLYDKHGSETLTWCREHPDQLAECFAQISVPLAGEIAQQLEQQQRVEASMVDVLGLLAGRGFPRNTAREVIRQWGAEAADQIKADPFVLLRFRGCGFARCDAMWLDMGLDRHALRRQAVFAWHAVTSQSNGDTWTEAAKIEQAIRDAFGSGARCSEAIQLAIDTAVDPDRDYGGLAEAFSQGDGTLAGSGTRWLAEADAAGDEMDLAYLVAGAMAEGTPHWPSVDQIEGLSDHQREQLTAALQGRIGLLCGSPGTGKTYTTARLVDAITEAGICGPHEIAIGAPTGKAAVRITESLHAAGIGIKARTWHSLLGIGVGGGFAHDQSSPWKYRILLGDESSMMDVGLMAAVMRARAPGCHVLLAGDVQQLPPVGNGAPFRDLIAAGVPRGDLREIKRNSGGIVEACAAIRDRKKWQPGDNLTIHGGSQGVDDVLAVITQHASEFDPVAEMQVLVAVNDRSPLSRKKINQVLQAELNSNRKHEGTPFRLGDKVVCLQNSKFTLIEGDCRPSSDGQIYVANGELGVVREIEPKCLQVELDGPRRLVRVPRGKAAEDGTGCPFDLAYALSVHKAQGSEFPLAIVVLDDYPGARRICDRSWIYTAISRAKSRCVLVGKKSTADAMCRRAAIHSRKTFLRERYLINQVDGMLVEL